MAAAAAAVDMVTKVVTAVILSEVETWVVAVVAEEAAAEGDIKKTLSIPLTLLAGKQNHDYFSVTLSICYFKTIRLILRQSQKISGMLNYFFLIKFMQHKIV